MKSNPKEIFAHNVRTIRKQAGLSQEELGYRANLHRTYISSVERGQRNVTIESIFAIARALGVPAADLMRPVRRGKAG